MSQHNTLLHTRHLLALCLVAPWWPTSTTVWTNHWTESWWLFCIFEFSIWVGFTLFLFVRIWAWAWTGRGSRAWLWPETKNSSENYIPVSSVDLAGETKKIRSSSARVMLFYIFLIKPSIQHVNDRNDVHFERDLGPKEVFYSDLVPEMIW